MSSIDKNPHKLEIFILAPVCISNHVFFDFSPKTLLLVPRLYILMNFCIHLLIEVFVDNVQVVVVYAFE